MDFIRKMIPEDLKRVMKIWYDGNLEAHDFVPKEYWDRNFSYVSRAILEVDTYVYEANGRVVGFIGMDEGYVAGLFVEKDFRGIGIGSRLLNYIKEDFDFFTLHVFENNYGAYRFYEGQGLVKKSEEVNEDLGEVEYLMCYRKKDIKK